MKQFDKILRFWRTVVALKYVPTPMKSVFDIGCDDGYLLNRLDQDTVRRDGIDPRLEEEITTDRSTLIRGLFPKDALNILKPDTYDAIFALATFEHFREDDLRSSADFIAELLRSGGRLIVTAPHPFVDRILDILLFLRLIDGQATDEHHEFDPNQLIPFFSVKLRLLKRKTFQFGLNNVFIFEKP